jgi:hypothetical protein
VNSSLRSNSHLDQLPRRIKRLVRLNPQHIRQNPPLLGTERVLIARRIQHRFPLIRRHRRADPGTHSPSSPGDRRGMSSSGARNPAPAPAAAATDARDSPHAPMVPFTLRFRHLIHTVELLNESLLLSLRQPAKAGIVAQHALLILRGNAAMRIEPRAQMARRRIRRTGARIRRPSHNPGPDKPNRDTPSQNKPSLELQAAWPQAHSPAWADSHHPAVQPHDTADCRNPCGPDCDLDCGSLRSTLTAIRRRARRRVMRRRTGVRRTCMLTMPPGRRAGKRAAQRPKSKPSSAPHLRRPHWLPPSFEFPQALLNQSNQSSIR